MSNSRLEKKKILNKISFRLQAQGKNGILNPKMKEKVLKAMEKEFEQHGKEINEIDRQIKLL